MTVHNAVHSKGENVRNMYAIYPPSNLPPLDVFGYARREYSNLAPAPGPEQLRGKFLDHKLKEFYKEQMQKQKQGEGGSAAALMTSNVREAFDESHQLFLPSESQSESQRHDDDEHQNQSQNHHPSTAKVPPQSSDKKQE